MSDIKPSYEQLEKRIEELENELTSIRQEALKSQNDKLSFEEAKGSSKKNQKEFIFMQNILENLLAGYWDWDIENNTEFLSPTFKSMFGYEDYELPNSPESWQKLIFQEDLPYVFEAFDQHVKSHGVKPFNKELRYQHKNGKTIWVICAGHVIEWLEDGSPKRMVGCHVDITALKEAQEKSKLLANMLDNAPNSITVHDFNGKFLYANKKTFEIHGYTENEFMSLNLKDLDIPESAAKIQERMELLSKNNECSFEVGHFRKNKSIIPLEIFVTQTNLQGTRAILSIATDMTERKKTDQKLRDSEFKYSTVIETTDTGYVVVDKNGFVADANVNYAFLTGHLSVNEILGHRVTEWTAPYDIERNRQEVVKCLKNGSVHNLEIDYLQQNGTIVPIEINATVIKINDEEKIITLCRDISERKKVKEALRKSEIRFKNIVNASPMGMHLYEIKESGRLVFIGANPAADKILNVDHSIFIGKTIEEAFPGLIQTEVPTRYMDAAKNGSIWKTEQIDYQEGLVKGAFEVVAFQTEPEKMVALFNEITERKRAEEELQKSYQTFADLLKSIPAGLFIYQFHEPDLLYLVMGNPAAEKMTGLILDDWIGKEFNEIWPKARKEGLSEKWLKVIKNKENIQLEDTYYSDDMITGAFRVYAFTIPGNRLGISFENITEIKQAEIAIQQSETKFRSYIENAPYGVFIANDKGKFQQVNPAACLISGYSEDELLKMSAQKLLLPEFEKEAFDHFNQVKENGHAFGEYQFIHKSGEKYWWSVASVKLTEIKYLGFVNDITERKQNEIELKKAKEKAEESDRLKTAFLQNMSHEIRTPMNAIIGFSEILNDPDLPPDKRKGFTTIIINSSNQLLSIVNDILTISSIDTQQEKVNINKVSVNSIIVELLAIFKNRAINQNISIYAKQQLSDLQSEIYTDGTKLTQILTNLLTNALKFTHKGFVEFGYHLVQTEHALSQPIISHALSQPIISHALSQPIISHALSQQILQFYVKDTGIGIKTEMQEKIFERFRQADLSINRKYGGTGLGLAISKAFTELLGGKIWVESESGKGSTFYFTIPYEPVHTLKILNLQDNQNLSSKTILVAEDEEYNLLYIQELLKNQGFTILHAKDGQEAIDLCRSNPQISLVLMDIKMPVMDGQTAAKLIKEFLPNLPIIAQSAYALEHEINKFKEEVFDDYITKPIKRNELKEKIQMFFPE